MHHLLQQSPLFAAKGLSEAIRGLGYGEESPGIENYDAAAINLDYAVPLQPSKSAGDRFP